MTSPAPDPTGKRAQLSAARVAFGVALAAALTIGVLKSSSTPDNPQQPAIATGCPDSLPGALVIRFATSTTAGIIRDTVSHPVVVCGDSAFVYRLQAHPEAGSGPLAILSPPDTTSVPESVAQLARGADSLHWYLPKSSPALVTTGLYMLAVPAVRASGITLDSTQYANYQVPLVETHDAIPVDTVILGKGLKNGPLAVWAVMGENSAGNALVPHYYYRPARGTRMRTLETSWAGSCWGGDPWTQCAANGGTIATRTTTSWLAEWLPQIIPRSQTVLDLTLIRSTSYMSPTLSGP